MGMIWKAIAGLVILAVLGLLFIYSGIYNVAADQPHFRVVFWALETARDRSIAIREDRVPAPPPDLDNPSHLHDGGRLYALHCQSCHLGPGLSTNALREGMNPKPPRLEDASAIRPVEEQFWIIKHGIKMSGMPAWGEAYPDDAIWSMVAFSDKLPAMSRDEYETYTGPRLESQLQ